MAQRRYSLASYQKGANVNAEDREGQTPLMMAAMNGYKELCIELVDRWNADVFAETEHGQTARDMANSKDHQSVVSFLDRRIARKE